MDGKQFKFLVESMSGILACQSVLFQLLVKKGILKREDVGFVLDAVIEDFNKKHPNHAITETMKKLRDNINNASPLQFPDWLQDMMGDEDQSKT